MADDQLSTKRCYVCQEFKAPSEFNRSKARKDGLRLDCRACQNASGREYDNRTRGQRLEVKRKWRSENKERTAAYHKKWADKNREHLAEYQREYMAKNPGLASKRSREFFAKHRDRVLAANRVRWPAVREATREARTRYLEQNRDAIRALKRKYKAQKRGAEGVHTADDVMRLFEAQGGRCAYCKTSVSKNYHVDHIRPLSKGGSNWPANLQILCPFCNISKKDRDPEEFARSRGLLI